MKSIRNFFRKYIPVPALVLYIICIFSAGLHAAFLSNREFADFFNRYISSCVRAALAYITGWIPFSFAESIVITLPITAALLVWGGIRAINRDIVVSWRYIASLAAAVTMFYTLFVFGFAAGYRGSTLADKLDIERRKVSAEELYRTAEILREKTEAELDDISFIYGGESVMPWSLSEMSSHLNDAYEKVCGKYDFVPKLHSNVKAIALSEPMTYTHISGVYTYYTGEANININFPDYTLPYTAAHELSHQRGIAPENEANFMAFLVCMESDEPYIRYSGYIGMLEYVLNALYSADSELYYNFMYYTDMRIRCEMSSYNKFYEKYRKSVASTVSNAINNTYLKSQGQSDGTKSYGMVVDLAVAYYIPAGSVQENETTVENAS